MGDQQQEFWRACQHAQPAIALFSIERYVTQIVMPPPGRIGGWFEGRGLSTSRVSPPGPLSLAVGGGRRRSAPPSCASSSAAASAAAGGGGGGEADAGSSASSVPTKKMQLIFSLFSSRKKQNSVNTSIRRTHQRAPVVRLRGQHEAELRDGGDSERERHSERRHCERERERDGERTR